MFLRSCICLNSLWTSSKSILNDWFSCYNSSFSVASSINFESVSAFSRAMLSINCCVSGSETVFFCYYNNLYLFSISRSYLWSCWISEFFSLVKFSEFVTGGLLKEFFLKDCDLLVSKGFKASYYWWEFWCSGYYWVA